MKAKEKRDLRLTLGRALSPRERTSIESALTDMLAWQRELRRWPSLANAPGESMPFVSLYANGRLVGCMGHAEGGPGERLSRAFLAALTDARFRGPTSNERPMLSAQVAYVRDLAELTAGDAVRMMEVGTHGIGVFRAGAPVVLLPQVACDDQLDPERMLVALSTKSGVDLRAPNAPVFLFRTEEVAAWQKRTRAPKKLDRVRLALGWLARLVNDDGSITFAIDARRGVRHAIGPMNHGRAAVVVHALSRGGGHTKLVEAARDWLTRECNRALRGRDVRGFPERPAEIAGTLALAVISGAPLTRELAMFVRDNEPHIAVDPWHAAQVVTALGRKAPPGLWGTCVKHLAMRPWAPWTALGARACRDKGVLMLSTRELSRAIRTDDPHRGGVGVTRVPETALTAITVEALLGSREAEARHAIKLGRSFLARMQLVPGNIPAALDPELAMGAFPASPIVDLLRGDIVAHAALALMK